MHCSFTVLKCLICRDSIVRCSSRSNKVGSARILRNCRCGTGETRWESIIRVTGFTLISRLADIATLDSASLKAGIDTESDVVGDLLFETCDLYDPESAEGGADDIWWETEDYKSCYYDTLGDVYIKRYILHR